MTISIYAVAITPANPAPSFQNISAYAPFMVGSGGQQSLIQTTEQVPGSGSAHVELFDPTNSIAIQTLRPFWIADSNTGTKIFQGYVYKVGIKVQATYRWMVIDAYDIQKVLDSTPIGAPDAINGPGSSDWLGPDATGQYVLADVASRTLGNDALSIKYLFQNYWIYPEVGIDTSTYVETIGPMPVDTSFAPLWTNATLRQAVDDISAMSSPATVFFLDQDSKAHLTAMPVPNGGVPPQDGAAWVGGAPTQYTGASGTTGSTGSGGGGSSGNFNLLRRLPQGIPTSGGSSFGGTTGVTGAFWCPAVTSGSPFLYPAPDFLTDGPPGASGVSGIGYEGFEYEEDSGGAMLSGYVNGSTDWVYNPSGTAQVPANDGKGLMTVPAPIVEVGGTGLVSAPGGVTGPRPTWLQQYLDVPQALDQGIRDTVGGQAVSKSQLPLVHGKATVYSDKVWHAGQILTITNTPAGLCNANFMIQRLNSTFVTVNDRSGGTGVTRKHQMEWGTAPWTRLGIRGQAQRTAPRPQPKRPGSVWVAFVTTFTQTAAGQLNPFKFQFASPDGRIIQQPTIPVSFAATVINLNSASGPNYPSVTADRDFSFSPQATTTDSAGQVSSVLTMATNWQSGDRYTVYAISPVATPTS